jgi:mannitol/fructose-specific phosphotransferase system IIA component (Ntr-type)
MIPGAFTELRLLVPRLLSDEHRGAIQELTKRLHATGRIQDAAAFYEAVWERESMLGTVWEEGVVFPHARGSGINALSLAVGFAPTGIKWGTAKGAVARVVFLLAIPLHETQRYLSLLAALSRFSQDRELFAAWQSCTQPEQMLKRLNSM